MRGFARLRSLLRPKRLFLILLGILLVGVVSWILSPGEGEASEDLFVEVRSGRFEISIKVSGELQAVRSVSIDAPIDRMRSRAYKAGDIQIQDLVPEGTLVDSGDYVGALDRTALSSTLKSVAEEVEKSEHQYIKAQLDSALTLRELRNSLENQRFNLEELELVLTQSKYEPPATIRKAEIDLERARRSYAQALEAYQLRKAQAEATLREAYLNREKILRDQSLLAELIDDFTIYAPMKGMVIYYKEWGGKRRSVGSTVSQWDACVATLPDLSEMISKTYVNEVDIGRVRLGLPVEIEVDAIPGQTYPGRVSFIANIGEQIANRGTRVFQVDIELLQEDSLVRPSMSTVNRILIASYDSVLSCPLECLHADDSTTFVFTRSGQRREVRVGARNAREAIITAGLNAREELYLNTPEGEAEFRLVPLDAD